MGESKSLRFRIVCSFFVLILLLLGSLGAGAQKSHMIDGSSGSEDRDHPLFLTRQARYNENLCQKREYLLFPAPFSDACMKEGELCNPLNDKCCSGYYCFGGLVPTCVRKP